MRVVLTVLLPLLLPSLIYFGYVALAREGTPEAHQVPWVWLAGAGLLLAVIALVLVSSLEGAEPGAVYHPPRQVDGHIEPGYFGPEKEQPAE
ncbi:MAG TPA: DUF6111 family protein [Methylomirabilota bacterium]|nr:DUF6111 family protein [Methylomirabilota bacterium]